MKTLFLAFLLGFLTLPAQATAAQVVDSGLVAKLSGTSDPMLSEAAVCEGIFSRYERLMSVPVYLLRAIALTESGRYHTASARLVPWPWAVQAQGKGYYPPNKDQAVALVKKLMSSGVQNIDVGCMQVNLMHHGAAFKTVEDALDPVQNMAYAAQFLREHYQRVGSWKQAVGDYHSRTPELGDSYAKKVLKNWNQAMTDAVTKGRLRFDKNANTLLEDPMVAQWDGLQQYALPDAPPEWYYPPEPSATHKAEATPSTHQNNVAKLKRVMQKQPADVIFVRTTKPDVPPAPAVAAVAAPAVAAAPAQKIIFQRTASNPSPEQLNALAPAAAPPAVAPMAASLPAATPRYAPPHLTVSQPAPIVGQIAQTLPQPPVVQTPMQTPVSSPQPILPSAPQSQPEQQNVRMIFNY
jgi:hypothetical protein